MSIVKEKALFIIEHCILQSQREKSQEKITMWLDRAYERIIFAWQLGMIDLDKRDSYLSRIGRLEVENAG